MCLLDSFSSNWLIFFSLRRQRFQGSIIFNCIPQILSLLFRLVNHWEDFSCGTWTNSLSFLKKVLLELFLPLKSFLRLEWPILHLSVCTVIELWCLNVFIFILVLIITWISIFRLWSFILSSIRFGFLQASFRVLLITAYWMLFIEVINELMISSYRG